MSRFRNTHMWWIIANIFSDAVAARKVCGVSILRQFAEIIVLKLGKGHLSRKEYYNYRLNDCRQFQWADKKRFFGKVMENRLVTLLKMNRWGIVAHDKYLFNQFFDYLGFPVAKIYGLYQNTQRYINEPLCTGEEELVLFIRSEIDYPFVSKPMFGIYGKCITAVSSFERETQEIVLTNGKKLSLNAYVKSICRVKDRFLFQQNGFLFQELLRPHQEIGEITGDRLCTIRFIVLVGHRGPEITRALWKITTGTNMADNFVQGNVLAAVDIDSGEVASVIKGIGFEFEHIENHPDTGKALQGVNLPDWQTAKELCLRAATAIPELPMQGWDIALTDRGPVLLEVNLVGGLALSQYGGSKGIYDEKMQEFLYEYGFK